jgi:glutathione synthase/RimK-type ligase-like ATP-grasp enzyme
MTLGNLSVLMRFARSIAATVNVAGQSGLAGRQSPRSPAILLLNGDPALLGPGPGGQFVDGLETMFRNVDELACTVNEDRVQFYETVEGRDLADFSLVQVVAHHRRTATLSSAIVEYLRHRRVPTNMSVTGPPTRLFQYLRLADNGLRVPATVCLPGHTLIGSYAELAETLSLPFVVTAMDANGIGRDHLICGELDFDRLVAFACHMDGRMLAQEFVPRDTSLHVLVLGGEARMATRHSGVGSGRSPTAMDRDRAELVDTANLDPTLRRLAERAAELLGSEVAEVDLVRHWTTGDWYVLDVSLNPAIGGGAFGTAERGVYAAFLREEVEARR